jgi:hypothetical protein
VGEALQRERAFAQVSLRFAATGGELRRELLAGVAQLSGHVGDADVAAVGVLIGGGERGRQAKRLGLAQGPVEHCAGDRLEQPFAHFPAADPRQRVETGLPAGRKGEHLAAQRLHERRVFAFRVDQLADPAEHAAAVHPRFDERALAVPGPPEDQHVRVVEQALGVEDPRVVHERSAVHVTADVDAARAQARFGDRGVGRLEVRG